jgi:subtilisin family serine protease
MNPGRRLSLLKIILAVLCLLSYFVINAQTADFKYEKGKIVFKLRANPSFNIKSDNEKVSISEFSFLLDVKDHYNITACTKPFYTANPKNLAAQKLLNTYVISFGNHAEADKLLSYISKNENVEYAEKVPLIDLLYVPNDSLYVPSILSANPKWLFDLINAEEAWDYSHGDPNIRVAIIDNAIWTDHPDLQGKFVDIKDFADNDNNTIPYSSNNDAFGRQWSHGTHVAGLAGANTDNNRGIASIGFNISLMAYKMYNDGAIPLPNLTAGIQAIQWAADHGAKVINISWGTTNQMAALQTAIDYAYNAGCIIVAAAGNNGDEELYYPAAYDHVIAVTSVGMDDKKSYFSNYGSFVDLSSPGGYGPTDAGTWSPVSTTYHLAYSWASILGNVRYDGLVGTSMATPVVSGLCGLMLSLDSNLSATEIEQILKTTSVNISTLNPTFTGKLGAGRIDAGAAMAYIHNQNGIRSIKGKDLIINTYPNPCNGILTVKGNSNFTGNYNVLIKDLLGVTVKDPFRFNADNNGSFQIDISNLSNGLYFMYLSSEKKTYECVKTIVVLK